MSWRLSPLCTIQASTKVPAKALIKQSNVTAALYSRRHIPCSHRNLRGITTSAILRVPQPADNSKTEEWRPINDGVVIGRKATDNYTVQPTQERLSYTTCVNLLNPEQNAWNQGSIDRRLSVTGMIKSIRKQKRSVFAQFTDGTCFEAIQVVFEPRLALRCVSPTV
jgi:hypothetical protein